MRINVTSNTLENLRQSFINISPSITINSTRVTFDNRNRKIQIPRVQRSTSRSGFNI